MNYCRDYKTLKKSKQKTVRQTLRHGTLSILAKYYSVKGTLNKALQQPRIQFIYIHHIFRDEIQSFRELLQFLNKDHTFISYSEAVNKLLKGERIEKPYITFSSDDGFKNNLNAAKVLNEFGAKCCFFLLPKIIGETDFNKITHFNKERLKFLPTEYLNWYDVEQLLQQGHEIGNHTFSHPDIASVSTEEAYEEIIQGKKALEEKAGEITHFAWPFGRFHHFNEQARDLVFQTGHISCASAERGCHINHQNGIINPDNLCIRRDHLIAAWPLHHSLYFLARNALNVSPENNNFPY